MRKQHIIIYKKKWKVENVIFKLFIFRKKSIIKQIFKLFVFFIGVQEMEENNQNIIYVLFVTIIYKKMCLFIMGTLNA